MIDRIVDTIADWGISDGYFTGPEEASAFRDELKYVMVHQRAAFNSPVWFNIGVKGVPAQGSACFILAVEDTMDGILNWYREEGTIFKGGSGSGINLSGIRSSVEHLKGGGTASGPVSFMRGADASAGTIKSGGKTRRAAKMVILNADHPDIEEFVWCKAREEHKARALRDAGFDMDLDGRDSHSIQYQNANNSVRVTDDFMQAVVDDRDWDLKAVTTGETVKTLKARELMRQFSQASWECADPGMQFDTTINRWHTSPNSGRINASNPCSEYMHVDNSACNLASINLMKYLLDDGGSGAGGFDVEGYRRTIEVVFTAQEILVGNADYPTEKIAENSRKFRQLGLGYANLGALLMAQGLPYDSPEGRAWAGAITALDDRPRLRDERPHREPHGPARRVRRERRADAERAPHAPGRDGEDRRGARAAGAARVPRSARGTTPSSSASAHGVRNAQATVLAPTGTIGLAMDCDTTGIEPDLALDEGEEARRRRHDVHRQPDDPACAAPARATRPSRSTRSSPTSTSTRRSWARPAFDPEHLPVFACSMGDNTIHYTGHVKMMGAVQPWISGAISKTVNMPEEVTVEDVEQIHIDAWKLGIKAVAIYRDNCKVAQPMATQKKVGAAERSGVAEPRRSSGSSSTSSCRSRCGRSCRVAARARRSRSGSPTATAT